jgi:Iap family predicted aminopeptidase
MKNTKNFYWSKETLEFFKELKNKDENEFYRKVNEFVKYECNLEENEYIEDLQVDLINQINKK